MKNITPELLLEFAPENLFLAALFIILLYAFKSLTVFFAMNMKCYKMVIKNSNEIHNR